MSHIYELPARTARLIAAPAILGAAAFLLPGCATYTYNDLQLAQVRAPRKLFTESDARRTSDGVCCLEQSRDRTDAIVVLLTPDRRISAKFHAASVERDVLGRPGGYRLRGEIDPELLRLGDVGPVDAVRAIADQLTSVEEDAFAHRTRAWVAAGLVRLLQHWPQVSDPGPAVTRVSETLERIPVGGAAKLTVDNRGAYVLEYLIGNVPN